MFDIISDAECVHILRQSLKTDSLSSEDVSSFVVERASNDLVGFMGEYYKLFVELKDERKLSYFIKSLPLTNEVHRKECLDKRYFDKETRLYTDLLGEIQKCVALKLYPKCYYTRSDIIVLEDLSTQPLRHITNTDDVPFEFFEVVLRLLAHLHAGSIAYERANNVTIGAKFKDILFDLQLTMNNPWYVTGIKGIVSLAKRIPKYKDTSMGDYIANDLYAHLCEACKLSDASTKYRNVLCHRDTWSRNVFFEFSPDDTPTGCLIVDFQLTRYSPQAIDVLTFLCMTTGRRQRDGVLHRCLKFYHSAFVQVCRELNVSEDALPMEEFSQSCQELMLVPLILRTVCVPLMLMPEGLGNKWRAEEPVRFDYYMNTDREEMFDRIISIEPGYKDVIFEPLEELLEHLKAKLKIE